MQVQGSILTFVCGIGTSMHRAKQNKFANAARSRICALQSHRLSLPFSGYSSAADDLSIAFAGLKSIEPPAARDADPPQTVSATREVLAPQGLSWEKDSLRPLLSWAISVSAEHSWFNRRGFFRCNAKISSDCHALQGTCLIKPPLLWSFSSSCFLLFLSLFLSSLFSVLSLLSLLILLSILHPPPGHHATLVGEKHVQQPERA